MSPRRQSAGNRRRRARGSLSKDEIIDAAIAIIERDGVDKLNMPELAKALDAGVMSVYWYFHSKDELLIAVVERVFQDMINGLEPVGSGPWHEEIVAAATEVHQAMRTTLYAQLCRAQPRGLVVRPSAIPVVAPRLEAELRLFQDTNVDLSQAARLIIVMAAYARGYSLMQLGADDERNGQTPEQAFAGAVRNLSPTKFPTLRAVSDPGAVVSLRDESLYRGLRLMAVGLKADLESARRP